jgi:hypothetical protein
MDDPLLPQPREIAARGALGMPAGLGPAGRLSIWAIKLYDRGELRQAHL